MVASSVRIAETAAGTCSRLRLTFPAPTLPETATAPQHSS